MSTFVGLLIVGAIFWFAWWFNKESKKTRQGQIYIGTEPEPDEVEKDDVWLQERYGSLLVRKWDGEKWVDV